VVSEGARKDATAAPRPILLLLRKRRDASSAASPPRALDIVPAPSLARVLRTLSPATIDRRPRVPALPLALAFSQCPTTPADAADETAVEEEKLNIKSSDGVVLRAILARPATPSSPNASLDGVAVVMCHPAPVHRGRACTTR
jgi:hypothetical protein